MLKQSPNRNIIRAKSVKAKHALQILLLLVIVISIWLIYQVNKTYTKKNVVAFEAAKVSKSGQNEYQILRIGRKNIKPRVDEEEVEKHVDEEVGSLEDEEIIKVQEIEDDDVRVERDEEIDSTNKEKSEGEHDQLQEFIEEDNKDAQEK